MKTVGLYFGTFNPIHIGHLMVAAQIYNASELDEIWFVVTPQNPQKKKASLLDDHHRLEMVYLATKEYDQFKVCDIEFGLPFPHYTSNTLIYLREKHPNHTFSLIIGEDNLQGFHKWKNYEEIIKHHKLLVYPRYHEKEPNHTHPFPYKMVEAPRVEVSASAIRKGIKEGFEIRPFLPEIVFAYLDRMNFYK